MDKHVFFDETKRRSRYSFALSIFLSISIAVLFGTKAWSYFVDPVMPDLELTHMKEGDFNQGEGDLTGSSAADQVQWEKIKQKLSQMGSKKYNPEMHAFFVNWDDHSFISLQRNIYEIDVLVPEWLHLYGADGEFILNNEEYQSEVASFIDETGHDLKIVPLINNYNSQTGQWDNDSLEILLSDVEKRGRLIDNLFNFVVENEYAGINIDFESISPEKQLDFEVFIRQLGEKFHAEGLEVSLSIPLDNPEYRAKELSDSADLIYLMAYDQHTISGNVSGPVSSQVWYHDALADRFATLDPSKTIVALGGYGYDWADNIADSTQLSFQQAILLSQESKRKVQFDRISGNMTFEYENIDGQKHKVWFLDAVSIYNQVAIANRIAGPKGYALWRLGTEDPSMWLLLEGQNNFDADLHGKLETIPFQKNSFDYDGDGEVIKVVETPTDGMREVGYDEGTGLIFGNSYEKYSSGYQIRRLGNKKQKKIVLTFDDGPNPVYTPQILNILEQYDAKATFFIIGLNAELNRGIVERIANEGHEIGSHTYTHPNISSISKKQLSFELNATERTIEAITGKRTILFRPPYGENIEPDKIFQIDQMVYTSAKGYYTIGINIDPKDWRKDADAEEIASRVIEEAKAGKGQVVLLHDGGGNREQTIEALPKIIEGLRKEGYEITTVADIAGISEDKVMSSITDGNNLTAEVNSVSITTATIVGEALRYMFMAGIVLGLARALFVTVLGIYHKWFREGNKKLVRKKYCYIPSVSVIVPAYNEEKVVVKTVNSILASKYSRFDVIVVDDGSKDDTFAIAQAEFADNPKVRVLKTPQNGGKSKALNFGISKTRASIIVVIDADTILKKDAIAKLVSKFSSKRVAAVAGNAKVGNRGNIMTRWQALEYITSQNLDRRAQDVINGISVVPGAIGAWKRSALMKVGGFTNETLAEDADLTLKLLRRGYRITYENEAIAFTEAPDSIKIFLKQRFRWMFGTLQVAWKHKDTLFRKKYGAIGMYVIPNVFIFQIFFLLISPVMDLMLLISFGWAFFQHHHHPTEFPLHQVCGKMLFFYLLFMLLDFVAALIPFFLEKDEDWKLLLWQPLQRFFYRQLMYIVAIKSLAVAIKGSMVGWGKFERKATVSKSLVS